MEAKRVRTRFAPSPTGFMHVGNLRTALYEYLVAKSAGGEFILRIEDTDQERLVDGAVDVIYKTLSECGLKHDEGPDIGGDSGPYIQSQRLETYRPCAQQLVDSGKAYYCFCTRERLDGLKQKAEDDGRIAAGYDRHCRDLPADEVRRRLAAGTPHVIRQKMPLVGETSFTDEVFGKITVDNRELEDQVLIKSDGFPTYNFANVIDDHAMGITHIVRGSEYLTSTPKYNLLYSAFGWDLPTYVHLPLIIGQDGKKLSKRHGSTSFEALKAEGYLTEAIINYIALLGWCPTDNRELFSLDELCEAFKVSGISKSPSVFDYDKLTWFNGEYIRALAPDDFLSLVQPQLDEVFAGKPHDSRLLAEMLQKRVTQLTQVKEMVTFLAERLPLDREMFFNKKSKATPEQAVTVLPLAIAALEQLSDWTRDQVHDCLIELARHLEVKNGQLMWPVRIAASGQTVTPGGAIEILVILGRDESLARLRAGLDYLTGQPGSA